MSEGFSVFEKIAKGELSSHKLYEDNNYLGILDAFPIVKGQALIFPKRNLGDNFWNLEGSVRNEMMDIAEKLSLKMQDSMDIDRVVMMIEGFDVPHVHIKLFPVRRGDIRLVKTLEEGNYSVEPLTISKDEFIEITQELRL